ncbi:hypothetical protein [Microcystis phage Mel-JY01]
MNNSLNPNQNIGQSVAPKIDLSQATDVECSRPGCESKFFHEVVFFKRISPLQSPTGKEALLPGVTYACVECGNINPEFMRK